MVDQTQGTCVIVLDPGKKKVLLGKRMNAFRSGFYGMPGGRMDPEEWAEDCAKRELLEEMGLKAKVMDFVGVIREKVENYTFIHFAFICSDFSGQPQNMEPDKCVGWEWFPLGQLPEPLLPSHKAAIDIYLNPARTLRDI